MSKIKGVQCGQCDHQFDGREAESSNKRRLSIKMVCPSCKCTLKNPRYLTSRIVYISLLAIPFLVVALAIFLFIKKHYFVATGVASLIFLLESRYLKLCGFKDGYYVMVPCDETDSNQPDLSR